MSAVVKLHDEKSEGLSRSMILEMVQKASGNKLTIAQCAHTWDRTILPYGQKLGLLTGYVKPQSGTSKRTAAGAPELQKRYYDAVTDSINEVRQVAKKVLKDDVLVEKMMPVLVFNLDEEALLAMGKNYVQVVQVSDVPVLGESQRVFGDAQANADDVTWHSEVLYVVHC